MSIFPRPLKKVLDKIVPFSLEDLIPTFNLGTGTADNTTFLRGDGTWATPSSTGGGIPHGTASGTDTYTVSISGVTSYNDGDAYLIRFTNGNTTGCTLNINGLGAIALYRNNDGKLIGGDILDNGEMLCIYNSSTNTFQCIGTAQNTLLAYVTNAETTTITKGQPVYAYGGTGDRLKVKLAYNTADSTSAQTVGLVLSTSIAANQKGIIIINGLLDGLSILPTSTWADGDAVYLGATAGSITKTKPHAPNHLVYLGFVTTASNGAAGRLYVRVQNGYELDEIHDVSITTPANNDLLAYESSTSLWKNKSLSALGIQTTITPGSLTKVDDTNVTLTLGGTPSTSLLQSVSLTLGWTGTLADSRIASSSNWNTAYSNRISSLTTTGSSGSATLVSNTLNIPTYTLSGLGGVPYTGASADLQMGNHSVTANNGTYNSAFSPDVIGVQDAGLTQYGALDYAKLEITNVTLGNTMLVESTGLTYPDLSVQTSAGVTSVTGTSPIVSSGGLTPAISIPKATASVNGYLASTDFSTFNGKQAALSGTGIVKSTAGTISYLTDNSANWDTAYTNRITSLTTTGSSGAATLLSNTLNIPNYTLTGLGGVPTARTISTTSPLSGGGDLSANRTFSITQATTSTDGYLSSTDWNTFNNKQTTLVSGTNIKTINGSSVLGSGDLVVNGTDPEGYTTIVKSVNQDVTNSGATDDTELQFSVVANGTYMVDITLAYSGNNTTGDYAFSFAITAGTLTGRVTYQSTTTANAAFNGTSAAVTSSFFVGVASADLTVVENARILATFRASANATFKMQIGQASPAAGRTSRAWKGSILKYKRLD